jgi:epoxyqueuosine reductase QueG
MAAKTDHELTRLVFDLLHRQEVDIVGVAPVDRFNDVPQDRHPQTILPSCSNVLVFGMRQIDSVIDNLPACSCSFTQQYHLVLKQLDVVALAVSKMLTTKGYNGISVPSADLYDGKKQPKPGHVYHQQAAVLAGLGEIGLNKLLLTPRFGPRIQLVSVVNDAPLAGSQIAELGLCAKWQATCKKACIHLCPAGCISQDGVDENMCIYYQSSVMSSGFHLYVPSILCGMCIKACPRQPSA